MNRMYKNNLFTILKEKNISQTRLSNETGISRQTISKIIKNEFYGMNIHTFVTLINYLEVDLHELGEIKNVFAFANEKRYIVTFNERNLALLNSILSKKIHLSFHFHPYSSNCCLNIDSKKYSNKFDFSGNIRINANFQELLFEIIDFDLWKISETVSFDEFFEFYRSFILALESYAEQLGFNKIIFNVDSYIDPESQVIVFPRKVNDRDLKVLIQDSPYDSRKNKLMKLSILKSAGYGLTNNYEDEESELLKNAINNQIDSMQHLTILEKEKLRLNLMEKSFLHEDYHVKKYFKYIN